VANESQRPDDKVGNIVFERHVYSGPQGDGFIDFEYKKIGLDMLKKVTHVGPEARPSHDYEVVADENFTERQQTGTTPVLVDVVTYVESTPGSGIFDQRIITQETHNQPVYSDVAVVRKHPYKAKHFAL